MEMTMSIQDDRPRPTIYEVAKRYTACLYALSNTLGIDPVTMLTKHREVITAVFMQASREGIKVAPSVELLTLPKLYAPDGRLEKSA
jgi:hypothetical protein